MNVQVQLSYVQPTVLNYTLASLNRASLPDHDIVVLQGPNRN